MKVLVVSHSAVVAMYREKFHALARLGCEIHLVVPPGWPEGGRCIVAPASGEENGITIHRLPARWVGKVGGYHLQGLSTVIGETKPDIIHVDEEPYAMVTWQTLRLAKRKKIPCVFFTWENILRTYKIPLRWIDRWVLRHAAWAIAGNQEAVSVLSQRGYAKKHAVIPQYGVNPETFRPYTVMNVVKPVYTIGFFGRLCEEKGILTLLRAVAELNFSWRLIITGNGPKEEELKQQVKTMGFEKQVVFHAAVPNQAMPKALQQLDVLVLPSQTQADWKEQFGRVLIEAMACEIPVIGSNSGEIPNVIGEAGLIFPEKDWKTLAEQITMLHADFYAAGVVGQKGRQRVLEYFTTERIVEQIYYVYNQLLGRHS
jgi:glycosyltransferase involved in cell wall biosynthesis